MTTLVHAQQDHNMHQPETAKNVHVYVNGDQYYPGRKFVVNRRYICDFDGFLNLVTSGLKPSFGAVRNIYTPNAGHRVNELHEINNNMVIVAGGAERFRKLHYQNITPLPRKPMPPKHSYSTIRPVYHNSKMNVPARWKQLVQGPCSIYVYGNRDINGVAIKMLLSARIMKNWDMVLEEITEKISIRTGQAVRRLYTLDGVLIQGSENLENGRYYVAVGYERFKRAPYGERAQTLAMLHSPRRPHVTLPPIKRQPKALNSKPAEPNQSYAQKYAQKKQMEEMRTRQPPNTLKPLNGERKNRPHKPIPPPPSSESDSVFHAKPVKVKRSGASGRVTQVVPSVDDDDDVYRAKSETVKAEEVAEDEDTKVDLPVDQMPADTIDDEDILDVPVQHEEAMNVKQERSPSLNDQQTIMKQADENAFKPSKTPSSPSHSITTESEERGEVTNDEKRSNTVTPSPSSRINREDEKRENAAIALQSTYRGHLVRRDLKKKEKYSTVASPIAEQKEVTQDLVIEKEAINLENQPLAVGESENPSEDLYISENEQENQNPVILDSLSGQAETRATPSQESKNKDDGDDDDDDDDDDDGAKPPNSPVLGQDSPNLIMSDIDNIDTAKSDLVAKEDDDVRSEENAEVDVQSRHVTPLAAKSETHTDKNPEDEESDKHNDVTEPVFDLSSGQAVQNLPSNDNVESNTLNEQEPNEDQNNLPERDAADGTEESEGRDTRKSQESETNLAHASSIIDNSNEEGEKQRSGEESQEISNTPSARPATSESTENTPQDQTPGKRIDEQPIPNGQPTSLTEQV